MDRESDGPELLKLLADRLEFEVFLAFGNVIHEFVGGSVGRGLDPENESDRDFIDRVAAVDDEKIDAGSISPTLMLAALATDPTEAVVYKHWTPEFCMGRD